MNTKLADIVMAVTKMFYSTGKEPSEKMISAFAEMLIPYDHKLIIESIEEFGVLGDGWATVSKIIDIYREKKEQAIRAIWFDMIDRLYKKEISENELSIIKKIARISNDKPLDDIIADYREANEVGYIKSRQEKFKELFEETIEQKKIESDIITLENKRLLQ